MEIWCLGDITSIDLWDLLVWIYFALTNWLCQVGSFMSVTWEEFWLYGFVWNAGFGDADAGADDDGGSVNEGDSGNDDNGGDVCDGDAKQLMVEWYFWWWEWWWGWWWWWCQWYFWWWGWWWGVMMIVVSVVFLMMGIVVLNRCQWRLFFMINMVLTTVQEWYSSRLT